jgi:hypothetical protein
MPTRMIFSLIAIVLVAAAMLYTGRQQLDATQAAAAARTGSAAAARKGSAPTAAPSAPTTEPSGSDPTYPVQPTVDVAAPSPAETPAPANATATATAPTPEAATPRASAVTP